MHPPPPPPAPRPPPPARFARCRTMANMYAFAEDPVDVAMYRGFMKEELALMKAEYNALLYGGDIITIVSQMSGLWA
mgnify:FL=1